MSAERVDRSDMGLIDTGVTLVPTRPQVRKVRALRWHWRVTDHLTGRTLADGHSWSERMAMRRREMEAHRLWAERFNKRKKETN